MKVLFVCNANVGRSQIAEALFNKLSVHESVSARTRAEETVSRTKPASRSLKDAGSRTISFMREEGVDVSEKLRDQLTSEMVQEADKVIVMADGDSWPDFLRDSDKVTYWDIPDAVGLSDDAALSINNDVKQRVKELVREIG